MIDAEIEYEYDANFRHIGVDGIKVQLSEAITRYRTRISENRLRGRIEMGLLL